jgi:hypothetical protein
MNRLEFIQAMIKKLHDWFLTTDMTIAINVDGGGAVTYDRKGAWEMLKELEQEEQRLLHPKRMMKTTDLRRAFD